MVSRGRANTVSSRSEGVAAYSDRLTGPAFIEFMRERLVLLRELLSPHGSIYVHTDSKIGHYLKVAMDEIFGVENFRNDVSRVKCNPKNFSRKAFGNLKDVILFYARDPIWNEHFIPFTENEIHKLYPKIDAAGRRYTTIPLHAPGETQKGKTSDTFQGLAPPPGRHWRSAPEILQDWNAQGLIEWSASGNPRKIIYLDEKKGKKMQDVWEFKDPPHPVYPTEKNAQMLDLIIKTSSNPGSWVLDCFCGSGTTLAAAQRLGRRWIGIDSSKTAISAAQTKLASISDGMFGADYRYWIMGNPHEAAAQPN